MGTPLLPSWVDHMEAFSKQLLSPVLQIMSLCPLRSQSGCILTAVEGFSTDPIYTLPLSLFHFLPTLWVFSKEECVVLFQFSCSNYPVLLRCFLMGYWQINMRVDILYLNLCTQFPPRNSRNIPKSGSTDKTMLLALHLYCLAALQKSNVCQIKLFLVLFKNVKY